MKKSILVLSLVGLFFAACNKDKNTCKTCTVTDPVFSTTVTSKYCQDGDNVIQTITALGVSSDTTLLNTTVEEIVRENESQGATCK